MNYTENKNASVLITGDTVFTPASTPYAQLAQGVIGAFDYDTHLGLVSGANVRDFYLAVGSGLGTEMRESAGQRIRVADIDSISYKSYSAPRNQVFTMGIETVDCDEDYSLQFEIISEAARNSNSTIPMLKPFTVRTECCEGCDTCGSGDANDVIAKMIALINEDGIATAGAVAVDALTIATHGTTANYAIGADVPVTELATLIIFNKANPTATVRTSLKITVDHNATADFAGQPLTLEIPSIVTIIPTWLTDGCKTTVTQLVDAAPEEVAALGLKSLEYKFSNGSVSSDRYQGVSMLNSQLGNFTSDVDLNTKYAQFVINYRHEGDLGETFVTPAHMMTIVAVPEGAGALKTALATFFDTVAPRGNDNLMAVVAAEDAVVTNTDLTEDVATPALDGVNA